jgi:hypothetical protein
VADIFHEVEEDVKRERYEKLWKAYGKYLIAVLAAVVLGTAGTVFWRDYQRGQREAESERFTAALALVQAGRNADAANAFAELADEAGAGYRVLALFQRASAQLGSGDTAGAVATYDRIADDGGASAVLRDLGRLLAARALLDTAPAGEVEARLAPLRADANPWRHSARELTAVLALKAGDVAAAREGFQALADDLSAPSTTRARAAELLAALGGSS